MNPSHRIDAIDAIKGLAILGVLFIHLAFTSRFDAGTLGGIHLLQSIFAWCVLAFFFASGFLHRSGASADENWKSFVKKRALRLLVPCVAFSWAYKGLLLAAHRAGFMGAAAAPSLATPADVLKTLLTPAAPQFYFLVDLFIIATAVHLLLRASVFEKPLTLWLLAAALVQSYWLLPLEKPHGEALSQLSLYAAAYLLGFQIARGRNTGILPVRPAGFQPESIGPRRQDAREPHSLEGCVPIARTASCDDGLGALLRDPGFLLFGASVASLSFSKPQILHLSVPLLLFALIRLSPLLSPAPLTWLGRRSGAVYVWHTPLVMPAISTVLAKLPLTGWPLILVMSALTLTVSLLLDSVVRRFDKAGIFRL